MKKWSLMLMAAPLMGAEPDMVFVRAIRPIAESFAGMGLQIFVVGLVVHLALMFYHRTQEGQEAIQKSRSHMWTAILGLPLYIVLFVPTVRSTIQTVDYIDVSGEHVNVPLGTYVVERLLAVSDQVTARVITAGAEDVEQLGDIPTTVALATFMKNRLSFAAMTAEAIATRHTVIGLQTDESSREIEYDDEGRPWPVDLFTQMSAAVPGLLGVATLTSVATDGVTSSMDGFFRFWGLLISSPMTVAVWAATAVVGIVVSLLHGLLHYIPAFAYAVFLIIAPFAYLLRGKKAFTSIVQFFLGLSLIKPAMYAVVMIAFFIVESISYEGYVQAFGHLNDSFYGTETQIQVADYINNNGHLPILDMIPTFGTFVAMLLMLLATPLMVFRFLGAQGGELASALAAGLTMIAIQSRQMASQAIGKKMGMAVPVAAGAAKAAQTGASAIASPGGQS